MGIRQEIDALECQTRAVANIRGEIEAEGAEFWERFELLQAREDWEADQQATDDYERWYLDKLSMEADAEGIAVHG